MKEGQLINCIKGCQKHKKSAQKELYKNFYAYVAAIAVRYSASQEEAEEIVNDSFMKVFSKIDQSSSHTSFRGWLRKTTINTAIDYYRKNKKHQMMIDLTEATYEVEESAIEKLSANEILEYIQQLPPAYRTVFNLYAVEGYKHHEIAQLLEINEGTSKSNLHKARKYLQKMIKSGCNVEKIKDYGG